MHHPAQADIRTWFSAARHGPAALVAMAAATAVQAASTIAAGSSARAQANFEANQMHQQAGQERATAQRQAIEQRRRTTLALSRSQAVAAASGAGASDPTVTDLEGGIAAQGEYNALTALFNGEERARGLESGARVKQFEGQQAYRAGVIGAGTKVLGNAANTMLMKYGWDGPPSAATSASTYDPNQYGPYELPWLK